MKLIIAAGFASAVLLGAVSAPVLAQTFNGYPCTVDCSGHEAGYDWAQSKGITDAYGCTGKSNSFVEGCRSYFEEQDEDGALYGDDDDYSFGDDESEDEQW